MFFKEFSAKTPEAFLELLKNSQKNFIKGFCKNPWKNFWTYPRMVFLINNEKSHMRFPYIWESERKISNTTIFQCPTIITVTPVIFTYMRAQKFGNNHISNLHIFEMRKSNLKYNQWDISHTSKGSKCLNIHGGNFSKICKYVKKNFKSLRRCSGIWQSPDKFPISQKIFFIQAEQKQLESHFCIFMRAQKYKKSHRQFYYIQ